MVTYAPQVRLGWDVVGPLQEYLTENFSSDGPSETLIFDAGLSDVWRWVNRRDAAGPRWSGIILWAREDDERIVALAETALTRHDNAVLRALVATIHERVRQATAPSHDGTVSERPRPQILAAPERPLVDRVDAVELLDRHVQRAATEGRGGALLLLGDSGIGKSRLVERAARLAAASGLIVLHAQCVGTTAEALLPIRDALSAYRRDRTVADLLLEGGPLLEPYVPFLESFLGLQAGGRASRPIGGSRPQGVYEGLSQILVGLARASALCLIVEDLTDADRDTLAFLEYLHLKSEPGRILTVTTVKRDLAGDRLLARLSEWLLEDSDQYEVPPLGREDSAELARQLPEGLTLPTEEVDRILDLAAGNPYFIEQLIRYAGERRDGQGDDLPADLGTVLSRRLALLDKATRRFVDAAAVALENTQRLDLVAEVAGVKDRTAVQLLGNAVDRQCLREERDGSVRFVQELMRRAVYAQLGSNERIMLHRAAAARLEADGFPATAAHHYQRAGRKEDATRVALEGAARAEYCGAYATAAELYRLVTLPGDHAVGLRLARACIVLADREGALAALEGLDQEAPDVRLIRAQLAFLDGRHRRAAEETERVLASLGAGHLDARAWLAGIYLYLGRLAMAREHAEAAVAELHGDVTMEARFQGIIGSSWLYAGDTDAAERWFHAAASALSAVPVDRRDRFVYTTILGNLGGVREALGDWTGARQFHDEALESRRAVSDARGSLHSLHGVLNTEIGGGAWDSARSLLVEARELATRLGDRLELAKLDHSEGILALGTGEAVAGIDLVTGALDRFRELDTAYDLTHSRFTLAAAYRAAGRMQQANDEERTARAEARDLGFGLLERLYPEQPAATVDG